MSESKIRAFGVIAIIGGLLNMVGDLFIVSQPLPADVQGIDFLEIMPIEKVRVGVIIGVFALSSWLLILPSIARGLARASALERWLAVASFAVFVTACVTFHCLFWPAAVAIQATAGTASSSTVLDGLGGVLSAFQGLIIISMLIVTFVLGIAIFRKRADYPRWVFLTSPIVTLVTLGNVVNFMPAPYAGYFASVMTTLFSTVFVASLTFARRSSPT